MVRTRQTLGSASASQEIRQTVAAQTDPVNVTLTDISTEEDWRGRKREVNVARGGVDGIRRIRKRGAEPQTRKMSLILVAMIQVSMEAWISLGSFYKERQERSSLISGWI